MEPNGAEILLYAVIIVGGGYGFARLIWWAVSKAVGL